MSSTIKLYEDENDNIIDITKYRGMVKSLIYLIARRLNIMFNVYLYARFQSNAKESHLSAIKRIWRYFYGTMTLKSHTLI